MSDIKSQITTDISLAMGRGKDAVILQVIHGTGATEVTMLSLDAIKHRGQFHHYPDRTEVFLWDGKPVIEFQPFGMKQEGLKITASQPYRLL